MVFGVESGAGVLLAGVAVRLASRMATAEVGSIVDRLDGGLEAAGGDGSVLGATEAILALGGREPDLGVEIADGSVDGAET